MAFPSRLFVNYLARRPLSHLLDRIHEIEASANLYLNNILKSIDEAVFEVYEINQAQQQSIALMLGERPDTMVWAELNAATDSKIRIEHILRLFSYFVLQVMKANEDGILPFYSGTGHATVLEQLRHQMEIEFGAESAFQIEDDASKELGRSVESWINGPFIQWHNQLYKKRPILWHLASPNNNFGVLIYYHKLDKDTLPKVRNVYLRTVRDSLRRQLSAAREANDYKTVDQLESTLEDQTEMDELLQAVIEAGYDPIIDDGVKANILPLQEAGLLRYKVV